MKKSHSFDIDLGKFRAEYLRAHEDTWREGDPIYLCLVATTAGDDREEDFLYWHSGRFIMEDGGRVLWREFVGNGHPAYGDVELVPLDGEWVVFLQAPAVFPVEVPEGAVRFEVEAKAAPGYEEKATVRVLIHHSMPTADELMSLPDLRPFP